MDKGFQHRHHTVFVAAQHLHDGAACGAEVALDAGDLHGLHQHAGQAEGHLLGELLPVHGRLEAIPKVNVQDLARVPIQHQVAWVSVAEAEEVADHAHHGQGASVVGAAVEPNFRGVTLQPEHFVQIVPWSVLHRMLEYLHLGNESEVLVVGGKGDHEPVLQVDGHFTGLSMLTDERMQGVAVGHPADESRVGRQWYYSVTPDG
mmetsp:Transcript_38512/g.53470  ORF Transcript_38512/g.53470 Transcript_38512/m.53470 type:complete len:204 (+) Transcript_38512:646-1257(+)